MCPLSCIRMSTGSPVNTSLWQSWNPWELPVERLPGAGTSKTDLNCLPVLGNGPQTNKHTQRNLGDSSRKLSSSQKHFVLNALNQRGQCSHLPQSNASVYFNIYLSQSTAPFKEAGMKRQGRLLCNLKFTISKQMKVNTVCTLGPIGQMAPLAFFWR